MELLKVGPCLLAFIGRNRMTKSVVNRTLHGKVQRTLYCTFMMYPAFGSSLPKTPVLHFHLHSENKVSDIFYTFLMLLNLT